MHGIRVVLAHERNLSAGWNTHTIVSSDISNLYSQRSLKEQGRGHSLNGNAVRFPTPAIEPHGGVLSAAADQTRSGGHMKAAGPISEAASAPAAKKSAVLNLVRAILFLCSGGWQIVYVKRRSGRDETRLKI
jgi:hypothetical protein